MSIKPINSQEAAHLLSESGSESSDVDKRTALLMMKKTEEGEFKYEKPRSQTTDSGEFVRRMLVSTEKQEDQKMRVKRALSMSAIEYNSNLGSSPPKHLSFKRHKQSRAENERRTLNSLERYATSCDGQTPTKIVEAFAKGKKTDRKTIQGWIGYVISIRDLSEACEKVETKIVELVFEKEYPIGSTPYYDVKESFRRFYCKEADTKTSFFVINNKELTLPKSISDADEIRRPVLFMAWLINELNKHLPYQSKSNLTSEEQGSLFHRGFLSKEDYDSLNNTLTKVFTKLQKKDFETVKRKLKELRLPREFRNWARDNLAEYLYRTDKEPKHLIGRVMKKFEKSVNFKILKRDIPCFRLLQSVSFRAFSCAEKILRSTYCPNLFTNGPTQPRIKSFPDDPTFFLFKIDEQTGKYTATQVKVYRFYTQNEENESTIIGKTGVHCTLQGNIASERRTGYMRMRNLELDSGESLDARMEVVRGLDLLK